MAVRYEDISKLSKIIGCSESYYKSQSPDTDAYYENTMYLVNTGVEIEGHPYSDLYYGARKFTDFMVVDNYPGTEDYPNNKIYLQVKKNNNLVTGYQVYFKVNDVVLPVATSTIASAEYEDTGVTPTMNVSWTTTEGVTVSTNILIVNPDGTLPSALYNDLKSSIENDLRTSLATTWQVL